MDRRTLGFGGSAGWLLSLALAGAGCGSADGDTGWEGLGGERSLPTAGYDAAAPSAASQPRPSSYADSGTAPSLPPSPPGSEPARAPEGSASDAGVSPEPDAGEADRCALRETRTPVVLYMSADDSNSMASPAIARMNIEQGIRPSRRYLRTYEFLNYYDVRYQPPASEPLAVVQELRPGDDEGQWRFQVGLQAPPPAAIPRGRVITFVLDTSGSMEGEPMERERQVVRAILHGLSVGDIVSMVEWNIDRTVSLEGHVVNGPDDPQAARVVGELAANGGTDLESGLRFGYELADRHYDPQRLNRVVLVSDGIANAGITDLDRIAAHADDAEREGIYLVGVGVGDGVNDRLMDAVTDAGRGAYVYVDSAAEARRIFVDRWAETMEIGLRDVRLELTLPWYMAMTTTSAEEVSILPSAVREQHLAPGDAMVFYQQLEACDLAESSLDDVIEARGTFVDPVTREPGSVKVRASLRELLAAPAGGLTRGQAIVTYADALAEADELFDEGRAAEAVRVMRHAREVVSAANPLGTDADLAEIARLIDRYLALWS